MLNAIFKKFLQGVCMLIVVSAITFALLASAGGDALSALRENPQVSEITVESLKKVYGLDQPLPVRYAKWLVDALRGDLGESFAFHTPAAALVWIRFLNSAILGLTAMVLTIVVAIFLSVLAVRLRNRLFDKFLEITVMLTASTPRMLVALAALAVSLRFTAPPVVGQISFSQLCLGSIALAVPLVSIFLAQLHLGLNDAMGEDFVRLARAKGLDEWAVIIRHAMRAAINPFLTVSGLSLGGLLGGSSSWSPF